MKLMKIPRAPRSSLDVTKLLAIVMVVFNHTGSNGYKMYPDVAAEPAHTALLAVSALIKIAVPLFFMASGALLLRKDEPYGTTLLRRVLRFALILLGVSLFFYWDGLKVGEAFSWTAFLDGLYRNTLTGHLWYLYSYLMMLLLLPFLRKLARGMTARDVILLAVVYQGAQLLGVADYALYGGAAAHTGYLSFFVAADYVVYPLLGHFIDQMKEEDAREETIYILLFLSVLAVFFTCVLMTWRVGVDGGWTNANREAYMGRLSLIPAVTVFYALKRLFDAHPLKPGAANALFVLGSCTFGVYLFDPRWRQFTTGVRTALEPAIGLYGATWVQVLCAVLLGLTATLIFKCALGGVACLARLALQGRSAANAEKEGA